MSRRKRSETRDTQATQATEPQETEVTEELADYADTIEVKPYCPRCGGTETRKQLGTQRVPARDYHAPSGEYLGQLNRTLVRATQARA